MRDRFYLRVYAHWLTRERSPRADVHVSIDDVVIMFHDPSALIPYP